VGEICDRCLHAATTAIEHAAIEDAAIEHRGPRWLPAPATGPIGQPRSIGIAILLSAVTFGIYTYGWVYKTYDEMKRHTGQGIGGGIGLPLDLFPQAADLLPRPDGDQRDVRVRRPLQRPGSRGGSGCSCR
jgi:hypothetical protein